MKKLINEPADVVPDALRGVAAITAVTSSMVSPIRMVTAPDACWATRPVSTVSREWRISGVGRR